MKKLITFGVVLLFLGSSIPVLAYSNEKANNHSSSGNWLYVGGNGPGNYSRIQEAIDNASDGDTVFVYAHNTPYREHIKIEKALTLLGENKNTTLAAPRPPPFHNLDIFHDSVTISTFTFTFTAPCFFLIGAINASHITISSCNFSLVIGISFFNVNDSLIENNTFGTSMSAIDFYHSNRNIIQRNLITFGKKAGGILLMNHSNNNIITANTIKGIPVGIHGLQIDCGTGNTITKNNFYCSVWSNRHATWKENYYGHQLIHRLPKIILPDKLLPIVNIDWHPAKEPYNISTIKEGGKP